MCGFLDLWLCGLWDRLMFVLMAEKGEKSMRGPSFYKSKQSPNCVGNLAYLLGK